MGNTMWSSLLHFHTEKTDIKYKVKVLLEILFYRKSLTEYRQVHIKGTRLLRPWDSPGKSTGVGCHFLLHSLSLAVVISTSALRIQL